jgi:hypothetical protein
MAVARGLDTHNWNFRRPLMRRPALAPFLTPVLILALTVCLASQARAADLEILGMSNDAFDVQLADPDVACTHRITGTFAAGDADRIAASLTASIDAWFDQGKHGVSVVCLDSPGGSIAEALRLADVLRENTIGTKLTAGARCESACALVFMAGSFFAHESGRYKWRIIHPTARLGFHAPSLLVPDGQYSAESVTRSYGLAMETLARTIEDLMMNREFEDGEHLKPSLMAAMLRTPPDSMMYVETVDQAGRWGITVGPVRKTGLTMRELDFRRACVNEKAWQQDQSAVQTEDYWKEDFIVWTDDDWGDTAEVIINDMTGDGCLYGLPKGASRSRSAPLNQVRGGFMLLTDVLDPETRLRSLSF